MLKWFRKYNKIILTAGASFLMVAFLLPAGGQMFNRGRQERAVGYIDGVEVTYVDRNRAADDLKIINAVHPILSSMIGTNDALTYLLMVHEARSMGLDASRVSR